MQPSTSFENKAPRLVSQTHYCVMGDVTVADGVAIAPGVVLKASPGSRIIIAPGACLAGGVCIQSRKGVLTIGAGANLGANVLVIGHGAIGEHACISPGSTLMNPQVENEGMVPPGSLVVAKTAAASARHSSSPKTPFSPGNPVRGAAAGGFTSGSYVSNMAATTSKSSSSFSANFASGSPPSFGQVTVHPQNDSFVNTFVEPPPVGPKAIEMPSLNDQNGQYVDPSAQNNGVQLSNSGSNGQRPNSSAISVAGNQHVYGKNQVNQLLSTLFPNRVS